MLIMLPASQALLSFAMSCFCCQSHHCGRASDCTLVIQASTTHWQSYTGHGFCANVDEYKAMKFKN